MIHRYLLLLFFTLAWSAGPAYAAVTAPTAPSAHTISGTVEIGGELALTEKPTGGFRPALGVIRYTRSHFAFEAYGGYEDEAQLCAESTYPGHFAGLWESYDVARCKGSATRIGIRAGRALPVSPRLTWSAVAGLGWHWSSSSALVSQKTGSDLDKDTHTSVRTDKRNSEGFEYEVATQLDYALTPVVSVGGAVELMLREHEVLQSQESSDLFDALSAQAAIQARLSYHFRW